MKAKYTNFLFCLLIIFFLFEIFDHTNIISNIFLESSKLWFYNLLPTLFPFFIITDLLSNYGFIYYISKLFGKVMKLFNLNKKSSYAFFMSIISGFPGNSKLIKELLDNKEINEQEATKLLTFTHFSNPLFIIGTIGTMFLNNKNLGILILIIHYLTNIVVGLLFRNIYKKEINNINNNQQSIKLPFIKILIKSINNSISTMLLIYGIIIVTSLLVNIISVNLNISLYVKGILTGLIEMTQGLKLISELTIPITIKITIITFFLSFGGISIHMQIMGILSEYKINYFIYLISRIIHASVSSILIFLIMNFGI